MIQSKDDEVASLKTMHREVSGRLQDVERTLVSFMDRFSSLDHHDATLRERLSATENQLRSVQAQLIAMDAQRKALEQRNDDLEAEVEHQVFWRRGFFPYLGMKVATSTLDSAVEVTGYKEPAKGGGVELGDSLTHVSFTAQRPIKSVADYQRVVADLPQDATVTIDLLRRGKKYVVQLQPHIASFAAPNSSGNNRERAGRGGGDQ
jgi:hypothetical protein